VDRLSSEGETLPHQSYNKPLLIEIYSEVHLEPAFLTPPRFFEIVPGLKSLGFIEVEFGQVGTIQIDGAVGRVEQSTAPRIRCWKSDKTKLVQLAEDMIAVNLVGPYPGWKDFRALFTSVHDLAGAALGTLPVVSLSLTTVDELVRPRDGFRVGTFFNCGGPRIPTWYKDVSHAFDITMGIGRLKEDGFNRQIRFSGRPSGESFTVRVNCVFHDKVAEPSQTLLLLETLHQESVDSFESIITDRTRGEVMGGAKHANRS
jgi:uncharacterized protein (TIGR04255 family)